MKKLILFVFFFTLAYFQIEAQEFRVNVTLQTPVLQKADPRVFETLSNQIEEFYNNTQFTEDEFEDHERIDVEINMTISEELTDTRFKADFAIQSTRPVFGSNYASPTFTHVDKDFVFDYEQFAPIDFSENAFTTNLASLLSFYAYVVLGLDYDSFSPYGGEPHFQSALQIINNVPQNLVETQRKGWRSLDGNRNRYWLMDNLLSPRIRDFRQAWYDYHRQGMDLMATDVNAGRAIINETMRTIGAVNRNIPNAMILQVFSNTKAEELVELFKRGSSEEQNLLIQTMTKVDPANAARYRKVR